jgi:hypothetical protein
LGDGVHRRYPRELQRRILEWIERGIEHGRTLGGGATMSGVPANTIARWLADERDRAVAMVPVEIVEEHAFDAGKRDAAGLAVVMPSGARVVGVSVLPAAHDGYISLGRVLNEDNDTTRTAPCDSGHVGNPIYDVTYLYDTCPTPTPGLGCTGNNMRIKGRLAMALVTQHCGLDGSTPTVWQRGTWYQYDGYGYGRLLKDQVSSGYGSFSGSSQSIYAYDAAGRRTQVANGASYNNWYGQIAYDHAHGGVVSGISTGTTPYVLTSDHSYMPFSGVLNYKTRAPYNGTPDYVWMAKRYDLRGEITQIGPATDITTDPDNPAPWDRGVFFTYGRDDTGWPQSRTVNRYSPLRRTRSTT